MWTVRARNADLTDIQRRGDGTTQITLTSDLVRLWDRICYPNPAQAFISQTRDYDVRTGARETVALAYINANAGPGALTARQVPRLRVPGTLGRGGSTSNRARFDNLGQLVASLMEPAGLRLRVVHTSNGPGPGYLLSKDWSFGLTAPTLTTAEVAAGGTGAARLLEEQAFTTQEAMWGRRVEGLVDQRQTTDSTEIGQAGYDALMEGMTGTAVDVKVLNSAGLTLGVDVPLGALVSASLDGLVVKERIREVSTTVAAEGGGATVTVEPLFGSTDTTGQTKWQRELAKALRRISVIERTL
jgi:hypothetical protein